MPFSASRSPPSSPPSPVHLPLRVIASSALAALCPIRLLYLQRPVAAAAYVLGASARTADPHDVLLVWQSGGGEADDATSPSS
ncbi:Os10g0126300 [Oryza sativa Japonica Group]|uniref:Os10g0126300 protein n=1 Tax=Oryza sativa subsp. japonica TaxID=39947 RepID=A0A0P0XSB7_ORYSJ|nr:Os10g0126300 [Oryza sativa Japonica Group]